MPKKPPKGAFYFFLIEYKQRCERNGERFPEGIRDENLKENAGAEWKVLPPALRKKYEDLAKEDKANRKADDTRKVTNMHRTFSSIDKMKMLEEEAKNRMNSWIEDTILSLSTKKYLAEYKFYLVHMNYFCITEGEVFHPAEIAIVEFSLGQGITDVYHTLIQGQIPLGYKFDAMQKADQSHKIPIENNGEQKYDGIFPAIKRFLEPGRKANREGRYPPMFTLSDNISLNTSDSCVKSVIKRLCDHAMHEEDPDDYPVYSLEKLFYELKNACAKVEGKGDWSGISIARLELEKDVFNFTQEIACDFHQSEDAVEYCSKSYVQRWVYLICDHCCKHLDIPIIAEKHLPRNANIRPMKADQDLEKQAQAAPFTWKDYSQPAAQASNYVGFEPAPLPRPRIQANLASMMGPDVFNSSEEDFPSFVGGRGRGAPRGRGPGDIGRGRGPPEPLSFAGAMKRK